MWWTFTLHGKKVASNFLKNHVERHPVVVEKTEKGQIIGMHQAEKSSEKIAETTKSGFRTVQCIIKNLEW